MHKCHVEPVEALCLCRQHPLTFQYAQGKLKSG